MLFIQFFRYRGHWCIHGSCLKETMGHRMTRQRDQIVGEYLNIEAHFTERKLLSNTIESTTILITYLCHCKL